MAENFNGFSQCGNESGHLSLLEYSLKNLNLFRNSNNYLELLSKFFGSDLKDLTVFFCEFLEMWNEGNSDLVIYEYIE
jgi:hypothetical protein